MGYYEPDPYNQPEKFGLSMIDEIEWSDAGYSFDLTVVYRRDSDGQLFYADDSGCSCPSPFEDYTSIESLTPCTLSELDEHLASRSGHIGARSVLMNRLELAA